MKVIKHSIHILKRLKSTSTLTLVLIFVSISHPPLLSANTEVSQAQIERVKNSIKALDSWLERANTEKSGLNRELRKVEKSIARQSLEIKALSKKNGQLNKELSQLNQDKKQQQKQLNSQTKQLEEQLKAIYLQGKQPAIKLLLDTDDPQDISRYIKYFSYLNDASNEQINQFKAALESLNQTQTQLIKQKTKIAENKKQLQLSKQKLQGESKKRKKVLSSLDSNIRNKSEELERLKSDQKRLEKLLVEVEQAIANLPLPDDSLPFKQQKSKLRWPGRGKIIQRFGSRIAQGKLKSQGIRIAVKDDSPVQAVHYGQVIFSDWLRGFGLLIILDHGEGYMSLYGNNKSLVKDVGEWVHSGDTIAYSGNSGGLSTSSLYFEIRRKGTPQNPLTWLSK